MKLLVPHALALAFVLVACSAKTVVVQQQPTADGGTTSAPGSDAGSTEEPAASECTAARKTLLKPIDAVSTGKALVVGTDGGVTKIYVDASGGGINVAPTKPRIYIKLTGEHVGITDEQSYTSSDWDLALKRVDIFTNGGDAGPGKGAGLLVPKAFDKVTAADADGIAQERFFTGDCEPRVDEAQFVRTTFTGWYDYDQATNIPKPKSNTSFVVKSADGTLYKVGILLNNSTPDGKAGGMSTGFYLLQVAKL